jgi:hypothetical protein
MTSVTRSAVDATERTQVGCTPAEEVDVPTLSVPLTIVAGGLDTTVPTVVVTCARAEALCATIATGRAERPANARSAGAPRLFQALRHEAVVGEGLTAATAVADTAATNVVTQTRRTAAILRTVMCECSHR